MKGEKIKGQIYNLPQPIRPLSNDMFMILQNKLLHNTFNQNIYDAVIQDCFDKQLIEELGISFIKYGNYQRHFYDDSGKRCTLKIQRIKDLKTGKTHALIPAALIPYMLLTLDTLTDIILSIDSPKSDSKIDLKPLRNLMETFDLSMRRIRQIRDRFRQYLIDDIRWFKMNVEDMIITSIKSDKLNRPFMMSFRPATVFYVTLPT